MKRRVPWYLDFGIKNAWGGNVSPVPDMPTDGVIAWRCTRMTNYTVHDDYAARSNPETTWSEDEVRGMWDQDARPDPRVLTVDSVHVQSDPPEQVAITLSNGAIIDAHRARLLWEVTGWTELRGTDDPRGTVECWRGDIAGPVGLISPMPGDGGEWIVETGEQRRPPPL